MACNSLSLSLSKIVPLTHLDAHLSGVVLLLDTVRLGVLQRQVRVPRNVDSVNRKHTVRGRDNLRKENGQYRGVGADRLVRRWAT